MDKNTHFLLTTFKAALLLLLLLLLLVSYSSFTTQTRWFPCPKCRLPATLTRNVVRISETHFVLSHNLTRTNISHIVFGIAGSTKTWKNRSDYIELWWQPNTTRGYAWLDEEPQPNGSWSQTWPPYRVSEYWTRFKSLSPAVRLARIVLETFRLGLPDVRWFVMGDDDTVFFPNNLVSVLEKYDHRQMYYIGGNSESVEQDLVHSFDMAFGGGGFALSYPLAAELVKILDGCLDRYYKLYGGDQKMWACVKELGVSLTNERGFHQLDIRGDSYGLLAAHPVAPLVSLHHFGYVEPLFPNRTQLESFGTLIQVYRVDPSRTLQQCFCYDRKRGWSVSTSWGYTVQVYPSLLTADDLERPLQTFKTWESYGDGPFTFNTRPVNPDPCEQPVIFFLDWVKEVGKDETLTGYRKSVVVPEKKCDRPAYAHLVAVERIIVSAFKMDKNWNKAPRRQCCEVSRSLNNDTLEVGIRSCKEWETITT